MWIKMHNLLRIGLVLLCCCGCDINARQQRVEEARRAKTEAHLRELGEKMHADPRNIVNPDRGEDQGEAADAAPAPN